MVSNMVKKSETVGGLVVNFLGWASVQQQLQPIQLKICHLSSWKGAARWPDQECIVAVDRNPNFRASSQRMILEILSARFSIGAVSRFLHFQNNLYFIQVF